MGKRIRADPGVRDELRVARQYQQPLSVVRGRVVEPGDPLWLPDDLDAATAFEEWLITERAEHCHRCGTRPDDWNDDRGIRRRVPPYVTKIVDCPGCRELADNSLGSNDEGVKSGWRRVELVPYDPDNDAR